MNKKTNKASILAVTMIILGIMLITAMSVSIVSIKERKASMGEAKSGQAFQNSQSGVELVMQAINKCGISDVTGIAGNVLGLGASCNSSSGDIVGAEGYVVRLFAEDGVTQIPCDDPAYSVFDVASIKSVGTGAGQQRAIEAAAVCYGANIDDDMVGWWKFDSNGDYNDYSVVDNDAEACTLLNYTSLDPPLKNVTASPDFGSDAIRSSFISFNNAGKRNCATIKHDDIYKLEKGTISFWFKYRGDPLGANSVSLFVKDANACDTRTDASDVSADYGQAPTFDKTCDPDPALPVANTSVCDCGHLGFRFNYPINSKFGVRFQNDGNGGFYALVNDSSTSLDWNDKWHLATLTFTSEKYVLYIDGEEHSTFKSSGFDDSSFPLQDPDVASVPGLEGLRNNDWNIFLGIGYPDSSGVETTDEANWLRQLNDMDDLRIYSRALDQCDVMRLYQETK
jgi:hypothetical protein